MAAYVQVSIEHLIRGLPDREKGIDWSGEKWSGVWKFKESYLQLIMHTEDSASAVVSSWNFALNRVRYVDIRFTMHFGWWTKFPVDIYAIDAFSSGHKLFTNTVCCFTSLSSLCILSSGNVPTLPLPDVIQTRIAPISFILHLSNLVVFSLHPLQTNITSVIRFLAIFDRHCYSMELLLLAPANVSRSIYKHWSTYHEAIRWTTICRR